MSSTTDEKICQINDHKCACKQTKNKDTAFCTILETPELIELFKDVRLSKNLPPNVVVLFHNQLRDIVVPWTRFLAYLLGVSKDSMSATKHTKKTYKVQLTERDGQILKKTMGKYYSILILSQPFVVMLIEDVLKSSFWKSQTLRKSLRKVGGKSAFFQGLRQLMEDIESLAGKMSIPLEEIFQIVGRVISFVNLVILILLEIEGKDYKTNQSIQKKAEIALKSISDSTTHETLGVDDLTLGDFLKFSAKSIGKGVKRVVGGITRAIGKVTRFVIGKTSQVVFGKDIITVLQTNTLKKLRKFIDRSLFQGIRDCLQQFGLELKIFDVFMVYNPEETIHNKEWVEKQFQTVVQLICEEETGCLLTEKNPGLFTLYQELNLFPSVELDSIDPEDFNFDLIYTTSEKLLQWYIGLVNQSHSVKQMINIWNLLWYRLPLSKLKHTFYLAHRLQKKRIEYLIGQVAINAADADEMSRINELLAAAGGGDETVQTISFGKYKGEKVAKDKVFEVLVTIVNEICDVVDQQIINELLSWKKSRWVNFEEFKDKVS